MPQKTKRRRFHVGTLVESSTDVVNRAAHKFVVRVRYYTDSFNYSRNTDYVIIRERKYLRE